MANRHGMKSSSELIDVQIDDIAEGKQIKLRLGNGIAEYGGIIPNDNPDTIGTYTLEVAPSFRGRAIGEKMMRTLIVEAKRLDLKTFGGHVESQYALDIRARIFGKNALKFFYDGEAGDLDDFPEQYEELPITFDQARQSLERSAEYEEDLEHREYGFSVEVDLSSIDTQSWDEPNRD
jgi:GNAT superfamily N-acetyltransferase